MILIAMSMVVENQLIPGQPTFCVYTCAYVYIYIYIYIELYTQSISIHTGNVYVYVCTNMCLCQIRESA